MFHDWADFYIIVGSSGGALIGLMFVVATLTSGRDPRTILRGSQIYMTPIVFHFAIVVIISALSGVPEIPEWIVGIVVAACAAWGFAYAVLTTVRLFRLKWEEVPPDFSDKCFYGIFPVLAYLALAVAAALVWRDSQAAAYAIGTLMLVILLLGIRNAWDLVTTLARQAPPGR